MKFWQDKYSELYYAICFFTRIPLPNRTPSDTQLYHTLWAWPIIGLMIALISVSSYGIALYLGLNQSLASIIAVILPILITGGLHEDGLSDCADSFGGLSQTERQEIMKDSHIGSFGVIALLIVLMMKWQAIAGGDSHIAIIIIMAAILSRLSMIIILMIFPIATGGGLREDIKQASQAEIFPALLVGFAMIGGSFLFAQPLGAVLFALLFGIGFAWLMTRNIGGLTGDVFGATCLITETSFLAIALG